jgi:competence protein ComEC
VAAAAAILLLAPRLADLLPGPGALREALAVTLAAQLGVAPVLLATFGPLPVASLPANLLAVPAAGLVMVWGLTGGLVAGVAGGAVAQVVHLPTWALLTWLSEVAARAARLPLGLLEAGHVLAVATGLTAAAAGRWAAGRWPAGPGERVRPLGVAAATLAVALAALAAHAPDPLRTGLAPGIVRWHHGGTEVLVLGGAGGRTPLGAPALLSTLRQAGVGAIDLLVVADPSVPPSAVAAVADRHPLGAVVTAGGVGPLPVDAPQAAAPRPIGVLDVGALEVRFTATSDRLVVEARPGSAIGAPR